MTTPPNSKPELRSWLAERRAGVQHSTGSSDARASAVAINAMELLRERVPAGRVVALFISFGHEPPTDVLVSALADRGFQVLLPRVVDGDGMSWHPYNGQWERDLLGIPTPAAAQSELSLADCAAVFVPALAASSDGRRLGRGAGYYDRALADLPGFADGGPLRIAVVDQVGLLPDGVIPMTEQDAWMDAILVG